MDKLRDEAVTIFYHLFIFQLLFFDQLINRSDYIIEGRKLVKVGHNSSPDSNVVSLNIIFCLSNCPKRQRYYIYNNINREKLKFEWLKPANICSLINDFDKSFIIRIVGC